MRKKMADGKEPIEQKVEETLRCLDEIETLASNPFFYARLQARLEDSETQKGGVISWILSARALLPAFLALLIALNVVSGIRLFQESGYRSESREENLLAFADTYSLARSGYGY
ncbi:MAG: hypothetical protein P8123_01850 [bacterium]